MAYVRLSQTIKGKIRGSITRMLESAIKQRNEAMTNYDLGSIIVKEKKLEEFTAAVLKVSNKFGYKIRGKANQLYLGIDPHRTLGPSYTGWWPLRGGYYYTPLAEDTGTTQPIFILPGNKAYAEFFELYKDWAAAITRKENVFAEMNGLLNKARSVQDLVKVWPSVAEFLPPEVINRMNEVKKRTVTPKQQIEVSDEFKSGIIAARLESSPGGK